MFPLHGVAYTVPPMSTPYRLVAIDVDGTLVNSRNELPAAHREALHRAHEAGLKVCLCTGRSLSETRRVIDGLGLDSDIGIFVFGAIVSRLPDGQTLHRTAIDDALAREILAFFHERGFPILTAFDGDGDWAEFVLLRGGRYEEAINHWCSQTPTPVMEITAVDDLPTAPVRIGVLEDGEKASQTLEELKAAFGPEQMKCNAIFAPNYGLHVVECFAPQVNKWFGIQKVARELGIADHEIAAIGDDVNDLEMIRHAGLGIAMGNANPLVKTAARIQVGTNNEDGVAHAIDKILNS